MPHISVKMLQGRSEAQKDVTCTVEDFDAKEWQDVFKTDIEGKKDKLYKKAEYDPKSLL